MVAAGDRRSVRLERVTVGTALQRAVALRCPRCGRDALYERPFHMRAACRSCGLTYEAEQGFFVGAIYVNYAATVLLGLGIPLLVDWFHPLSLVGQLVIAVPLMLSVPVLFFHHSRSLWLAVNNFIAGLEQRAAGGR